MMFFVQATEQAGRLQAIRYLYGSLMSVYYWLERKQAGMMLVALHESELPQTSQVQAFKLLMTWLLHMLQLTKEQPKAQLPYCCKKKAIRFVLTTNKPSDLRREPYHHQYHDNVALAGTGQKNCLRSVKLLAGDFLKRASSQSTVGTLLECVAWKQRMVGDLRNSAGENFLYSQKTFGVQSRQYRKPPQGSCRARAQESRAQL